MQFSETRHIRIDGTRVALDVSTDDEARQALSELRQKKREFQHVKRRLRRALEAARKSSARRGTRARRKSTASHPAFASPLSYVTHSLGAVVALVRGGETAKQRTSPADVRDLEADLARVEETMLNLDEAIVYVAGRLPRRR